MAGLRTKVLIGFSLCAVAVICSAATRKAGLWEETSTTTWQKSPTAPGGEAAMLKGGTHKSRVCLTQEMIDQYGALLPQSRGQCALANKVVRANQLTADWICTGMMSGKGALESTWTDPEHATNRVHFVGTLRVGAELEPIEWTTESSTVFKSSDCGSLKPPALPGPHL